MTVRWKPLMILSGLFLVVALIGVIAITAAMLPKSSQGILKVARAAREAGRFPEAEIYFKQALQVEPRNPAIHEEFAALYAGWMPQADAERRAALRAERLLHLRKAFEYDKAAPGPRRELLRDAMEQDVAFDAIYWARELLNAAPEDLDAHYILASEGLEERAPNVAEIKRHLEALEKGKAPAVRRLWVRARLAEASGDNAGRAAALAEAQALPPSGAGPADPVDQFARLRLTALEIRSGADWKAMAGPVARLGEQVKALGRPEDLPPSRVDRLRSLLEQAQWSLSARSAKLPPEGKKAIDAMVDAIEVDLERVFQQALADGRQPDIQTFYSYAAHLRLRRQPDRCLEIVDRALKSPQAAKRTATPTVLMLHRVAIDMILTRDEDKARFDRAMPHVQALLESPDQRSQAIGHMVAGSIDLDRSGVAREASPAEEGAAARASQARLRAGALNHLKLAAAGLPDVAEAQAKYGVALVLAQEQNLGRQYLQNALRLGNLEPQYQIWAAWTILQAGYPEEAEPIVQGMLRQVDSGNLPRELEGTLHLLSGELYQARRSPEDLKKAVEEFDKATAAGQAVTPTAVMRLAQIDVQLGQYDRALARLQAVRSQGKGGATAEQLAIQTLEEKGDRPAARALLKKARGQYPHSPELVGLEAALLVKDGQPAEADAVLERFLGSEPENQGLVLMRAQIQVENLKKPDRARELLKGLAEHSESSTPLIQLAGLELEQGRIDEAAAVADKIRARWKDSATVDVLDAQVALRRNKMDEAVAHFDAALRKDPGNKIVQYWKAKLEGQLGSVAEAAHALEDIVRDRPVKEVDTGTSLQTAAQSALASLSLQARDFDDAIRRFEELKRSSSTGTLSRGDRWKLVTAYINKDQWPQAKREIAAILNDAKSPPSAEERVRGANYYRQQGENAAALAQIDYVLKVEPTNPAAVVTRSYILLEEKQPDRAVALLRGAIERTAGDRDAKAGPPPVFYLMLAVAESARSTPAEALPRTLEVIDEGLKVHPGSMELIQARYLAMLDAGRAADALAFVEARAKEDPKGPLRRLLVEKLREQKQYERAEQLLAELHDEFPDESKLAAALVQVVSLEASEAGAKGQADRRRQLEDRAASMIREYRAKYPKDAMFLHAECDMAARRGDLAQAIALTREIDKVARTSTLGPLLRVRLFTMLGRPEEVARAYGEAIDRDRGERQLDYRVALGRIHLQMGDADEAIRQAGMVLTVDKKRIDAMILQASGLAASGATPAEKAARRREAQARLAEIIKANPKRRDAYQAMVAVHLAAGERAPAIAALKEDLRAIPTDADAAGQLVQLLSQRGPGGREPAASDVAEARRIAEEIAARDAKGPMMMAMAAGFQRAGQLDPALDLARKGAAKLDTPGAHLALGDLLLAAAEARPDDPASRREIAEAVGEYDRVLKVSPDSIEAVNNKAWILHTHLGKSREALDLAMGLRKRAVPLALPCEFFDTLGAIQESVGQAGDAETSYLEGLKKDPKNAALNFHYGKLLTTDKSRAAKARAYLTRALADRGRLSATMAREADRLVADLSGRLNGN